MRSENAMGCFGLAETGRSSDWQSLISTEHQQHYADALAAISVAEPCYQIEYRVRNPATGGYLGVLDRGEGEFDAAGRLITRRGAIIDITGCKSAESNASDEAGARLAAIFECSEDAIISKSLKGIVASWNKGAERLLGYSAGEMVGESVWKLIPQEREEEELRIFRTLSTGETIRPFESVRLHKSGQPIHVSLSVSPIRGAGGEVVGCSTIARDITERKTWEKRQSDLLRELSHRVKNSLAVIQSVARQTLRASATPKAFVEAFEGRIHSLATSHSLLTDTEWRGAGLHALIGNQTASLSKATELRCRLRGPEVLLSAETATQFGLVLHELTANASKFGALSNHEGWVDVVWSVRDGHLSLLWREAGGPEIARYPEHIGFGTILIASSALKVRRRFARRGLVCRLEMAL